MPVSLGFRLAGRKSGDIDVATKLARFVGLGIWKGGRAVRFSEPETLLILEIEIDFSVWPDAACQKTDRLRTSDESHHPNKDFGFRGTVNEIPVGL
jgi:hypothetical protein